MPYALCSLFFLFLFPVFIIYAQESFPAETRWYRSNSSGMPLELIASRAAAMRNEYCLSVQTVVPGSEQGTDLPRLLVSHYDDSYQVELRMLYENGAEIRRQWIFRDTDGTIRLSASGSGGLFSGNSFQNNTDEQGKTGFIEVRNNEGSIIRERRFDEDLSEWEFRFAYNGSILLSGELWFKEAPPAGRENETTGGSINSQSLDGFILITTDYYRYNRSGSLRAIDRTLHEGAEFFRVAFPRIAAGVNEGMNHGIAYSSLFLLNDHSPEGANISYTFDGRGRILTEVWKDEDGGVLGEFINTWSDDRLLSSLWKSGHDERLVEFEYDDTGSRIAERHFRRGILERSVTSRNGRDIEEIYLNGRPVLRVIWENGVKISEERINR